MKPVNKAEDRDLPCSQALKDESDLVLSEIESKAPYYVLRMLNGAYQTKSMDGKKIHVRSCGNEFVISKQAYEIYSRVSSKIKREECDLLGINPPFSVEDQIRIMYSAAKAARVECTIDPKKLRVYFMRQDTGGCGFYRVMQPTRALNEFQGEHIIAEESDWITFPLGQRYDVIVAPRVSHPLVIGVLKNLQACGKLIVYESDDLLSKLPDYNPFQKDYEESAPYREFFLNMVNAAIVSTEELRGSLGRQDVTYVCHNAINENFWPMKARSQSTDKVRIVWGGSATHEGDLKLIVPVIKRLIQRFEKKIEIIWVNYVPNDFICAARDADGRMVQAFPPQFREYMRFVPGCHVANWSKLLDGLNPNIALAPLIDNEFNRSKSEIKVLEAWALGVPIVASDVAPYRRAINSGENGILCPDNVDIWFNEVRRLVEDAGRRTELAENGLEKLRLNYTTRKISRDYLRALLTIADGKTVRAECNEAIRAKMEAESWTNISSGTLSADN